MPPYRPPAEWLQWLDDPPASWADAPRYVPIGGQLHLTTISRLENGSVIVDSDDGTFDDVWVYADEGDIYNLDEMR